MAPIARNSRHTTMEPDSSEGQGSGQQSNGETGGELMTTTSNVPALPADFPGLSQESSNSLTSWMTAAMIARDARLY